MLNCSSTTSNLTCVRNANATTIQNIVNMNSLSFNPWADNVTLVASPAAARQAGSFAKVPVMGGTNAQEGRVFQYGMSNITALANAYFSNNAPQIIPAVLQAFAVGNITGYNTGYDQVSALQTAYSFLCPQALWANETAAQGVSTWRYFFNASFPNTQSFPNAGVFHSSEIQLVFQTYPGGPVNNLTAAPTGIVPTNLPPTAQEYTLSQTMNTAWAAFAKNPMHGPGWNKLGTFPADGDLGALGNNGSAGVTIIKQSTVDYICPLFFPAYRAFLGPVYGLNTSLG